MLSSVDSMLDIPITKKGKGLVPDVSPRISDKFTTTLRF